MGGLVGTLLYLAPEVTRGQDATAASDVFQVGLILHEALTGRHRYYQGGLPQSHFLAMAGPELPLPTAVSSLPPDLASVIHACCALDPSARPSDGAALVRLLERQAPPEDSLVDLTASGLAPQAAPAPAHLRSEAPRSTLLPALVLVGLLLATALILSRNPTPAVDVVEGAVEWLRFPDGFTLTFHGGLAQAPSWTCSWPGGHASGAFFREGGH
jgi:serine/threonine-protein kinase